MQVPLESPALPGLYDGVDLPRPKGLPRAVMFVLVLLAVAGQTPGGSVAATVLEPSEVTGLVRSSVDGSPINAVTITVEEFGSRVFSDPSGRFRFADIPSGTWTLVAERLGFASTRITVEIPESGDLVSGVEILLDPDPVLVSGVVITTSGEFQRRVESPTSVTRVDGTRIREVNPTHPFELLNRIPGVWVSPTSTEGHMTSIRQPITTNPVYLFLEDGVPTRSPGFFNHNALYEVNVPHADHVEVIRGPGTALYGSDAIGGVIDVGTRAPSNSPQVEGSLEGNSLGFARVLVTASTTRGNDGLRLDANLTEGDRWRDHGDYDRKSVTVRWDRAMSAGMSLRSSATYSNVFQSDPSVLSRDEMETDPTVNRHPITYRTVEAFRLQSQFERRTDRSLLHVTPFVRWNRLDLMPSWMLTYDPVIYESGHASTGVMARYHRDLFPLRGRLTTGLDVDRSPGQREEDRISLTRQDGIAVEWNRGDRIYDYSANFLGVSPYLQLQLHPLPGLHLTSGLRYDDIRFEYRNNLTSLQSGPHRRPEDTTIRYSNLGPSVGGALTLSDHLNFFAGYRESFRSPSEGQLFRQGSAESTVNLNPVTARSMDGGVRGEVTGRVAYEVSLYRMDVRDDIVSYVRPEDGLTESLNAGRTRHQGVEVGLTAAFTSGIQGDVSLTRASHEFLEWSPRPNVDFAGNEMPQAPRYLASARLRSRIPGFAAGMLEVEWVRMGGFWMDPENENRYEGHTLWNLRAELPIRDGVGLSARLVNVGDVTYAERATYNAFRGEELSPGKPRFAQIGLRYVWEP